ncbi:MAG: MBL fold metallo-hydrolase, partial [Terriglobia bacterium]
MQIHFWGVRGSLPAPEHHAWTYGGNTPCVEVRAGNQLFILDAGSGIRNLGRQLLTARPDARLEINLLLSHYHWDHIQGLPFFAPIYRPGCALRVIGPRPQGEATLSLSGVLNDVFRAPYFPVAASQLQAQVSTREVGSLADFAVGGARIRTCPLNHPQGALAYRIDYERASLVYATDYEPGIPELDRALRRLARGADVLISDAQYYPEELRGLRKGWGHSSWEAA